MARSAVVGVYVVKGLLGSKNAPVPFGVDHVTLVAEPPNAPLRETITVSQIVVSLPASTVGPGKIEISIVSVP